MLFKNLKLKRGFTLVELLVVISISMAIMTALVIQHNKWNDSLTVSTQAYELALMIRQAQIYSLGVKEDTTGTAEDKFAIGYGIYIDEDFEDPVDNKIDRYIFFADRNGNKKYDNSPEEMIGDPIILTKGVRIENFCGVGANPCSPGLGSLNQANITFFRPESKANIRLLNHGGGSSGVSSPVTINLISRQGKIYSVKVESNGQVSITQ